MVQSPAWAVYHSQSGLDGGLGSRQILVNTCRQRRTNLWWDTYRFEQYSP
jgi:hypothetical protein